MTQVTLSPDFVLDVVEGPYYEVFSYEDGEASTRFDFYVDLLTPDNDLFRHDQAFRTHEDAERFVATIRKRGAVNLLYWTEVETMSLEEKFDLYAEREAEVRLGFRPEWDMYHGIP